MKNITLIALYFFCTAAFAQQALTNANSQGLDNLIEAEMKAAYSVSSFTANLNTGNYDVTHQTLELTVDPAQQNISGTITTTYTATESMGTLTFDLVNDLTVSSVTKNGSNLTFTQNSNDELVITLPSTQAAGTSGTVKVTYSGQPSFNQDAFVTNTHNGTPILWTVSEPYGAREWWPCKQDLNDKIGSIDVYITAPSQYVSVSNGVEQSQTTNSNGTKTTHFAHNHPIPAYLVAIAVTNYSVYTQTGGTAPNTFPIVNYLYPETFSQSQSEVAQTLPIMDFYEQTFESYPFNDEKYGHAQFGAGGGMEHTTVSFMTGFGRELIAHEMAHQWFGDKITCGSWQDIWLNEGFATYLSGLVVEHQDGNDSFRDWKSGKIDLITAYPYGAVYVPASDTLDENRVFSSRLTYNKGAMVLNMLRFKLGSTVFYQGLKNYLADANLAYAYAKTPDFKAHLEAASGISLTEFFNDWVYNQGYPTYTITVSNGVPGQAHVVVSQTQSDASVSFFEMPVPLRFTSPTGTTYDVVLDNTTNNQSFTVPIPLSIASVAFNAEKDIISVNSSVTLSTAQFNLLEGIRLYPNPTADQLNFDLPQGLTVEKATFYNTLGQKVLEAGSQTSFNVAGLATGIHFITLVTNHGTRQLKFIKE